MERMVLMAEPDYGPTLDEFLAAYEADDNEWWRVSCGQHQNWFEEAVDRWRAAHADNEGIDQMIDSYREDVETRDGIIRRLLKVRWTLSYDRKKWMAPFGLRRDEATTDAERTVLDLLAAGEHNEDST